MPARPSSAPSTATSSTSGLPIDIGTISTASIATPLPELAPSRQRASAPIAVLKNQPARASRSSSSASGLKRYCFGLSTGLIRNIELDAPRFDRREICHGSRRFRFDTTIKRPIRHTGGRGVVGRDGVPKRDPGFASRRPFGGGG